MYYMNHIYIYIYIYIYIKIIEIYSGERQLCHEYKKNIKRIEQLVIQFYKNNIKKTFSN